MAKKKLVLTQRVISMDHLSEDELVRARHNPGTWPREYVVKKVIGSTTPQVFQVLSKIEADAYCNDENWEVTIQ